MGKAMKITAVGDMLIHRRIPHDSEGFQDVKQYISQGDAAFFNLETTLHTGGHWGNQFYGGSYLRADPRVLEDAEEYGFNMLSFANNHTLDYSYGGLLATLDAVNQAGFVHTGVGTNLDEAAAPAYLDTANGRVALISVVSTMMNVAAMAGQQSRRVPGRPGVNGLRIDETIVVTPQQLAAIQEIVAMSSVNAKDDISRAEGYSLPVPEGQVALKDLRFQQGNETRYHTKPNQVDMARVEKAIYEAQMNADFIIVSIHSHEVSGTSKENPGEFLVEFAHRCIDAGVHAVIGHGPHLLRPIEIYKSRPIFYSLGDFVLHNESVDYFAEDVYEKYGLTSDATMREVFQKRSKNYTRGLLTDRRMLESVAVCLDVDESAGVKGVELLPLELNFEGKRWQCGNPAPCFTKGILERLQEMSAPYGTKISILENGHGYIRLS